MSNLVFGIDFGTTNSLATVVVGDRALAMVDQVKNRPHPSAIWYQGGAPIVGWEARKHMDLIEGGAPPGFLRSPKMALRRDGPIYVDGRPIDPKDAVAEVLAHLKNDASRDRKGAAGHELGKAVFTIPVDFGGPERRALRDAANRAGIGIVQFVHEPVAALYAFLRSRENLGHELARLEGRFALVFDWGGGTLDLTLCRIIGGSLMQARSLGDNEIGGDRFDERLRNLIRSKHATAYGIDDITALEQPGMAAKLLHQSEILKIHLSHPDTDDEDVIIRDFLKVEGPARNLVATISKGELDKSCADLVARGLSRIDEILEQANLSYQDIELCLATGGMVNMPSIRDGLTERFVGRVPSLENGDRIISEGAAWIANDGLRLTLSKPIEILVADTTGRGIYHSLVNAGWTLPVENEIQNVTNSRLFCVDPREGEAVVEFAKPVKLGKVDPRDARQTLCVAKVEVSPHAAPLIERIECSLQIDHDYVAHVMLRSSGRSATSSEEFHDLDFGLTLPISNPPSGDDDEMETEQGQGRGGTGLPRGLATSNLFQRTNVAVHDARVTSSSDMWRYVPGDLVDQWRGNYFDTRNGAASARQLEERAFYIPCSICKRTESERRAMGPVPSCTSECGF